MVRGIGSRNGGENLDEADGGGDKEAGRGWAAQTLSEKPFRGYIFENLRKNCLYVSYTFILRSIQ